MSVVTTTSHFPVNVTALVRQTDIVTGIENITSTNARIVSLGLRVAAVNMSLEQLDRMRSFKSNAIVTLSTLGGGVRPLLSLVGTLEWSAHDIEDGVPQFFYLMFRNTRMRILDLSLTSIRQIKISVPLPSNCIVPGLDSAWVKVVFVLSSPQVAPRLSVE